MSNLLDIDSQRLAAQQQQPTPMVRQDGALVMVSNPAQALQMGYKMADQDQVAEMQRYAAEKDEFSNSPIKAGLAGAARGLTFGLSDPFLTKTGLVKPETLKGLEEQNPEASTIGEIAGNVGGLALAPEASLPGMLEKGAARLGEKAVASMAEGAAKKVLAKTASDAVQGAAYGAGNLLSQNALGNADLTGEQLFMHAGMGALLAGGIGGGLTGTGLAAERLFHTVKIPPALKYALGDSFAEVAGTLSDKDPESLKKIMKNLPLATSTDAERQNAQNAVTEDLQNQYSSLNDFAKATMQARPKQTSKFLSEEYGNGITEKQMAAMEDFSNKLNLTIQRMRAEPEIYSKVGSIRRLEIIHAGVERDIEGFNKRPDASFLYLNDIKQELDGLSNYGGSIGSDRDTIREIRTLRGDVKDMLQNQDVWGTAADRQKTFNRSLNEYLTAERDFRKYFTTKSIDRSGNEIYTVDSNKMHGYFHNLELGKNTDKNKALDRFLTAAQGFQKEAEKVHADLNVPVSNLPDMQLAKEPMDLINASNELRRLKSPYRGTGIRENLASAQGVMNVGAPALMGHPLVAAGAAAFNALSNPVSLLEKVAAVQKYKANVVGAYHSALDKLLEGKAADMSAILAVDLAGREHLNKDRESQRSSADIFKDRVQEVKELAQNPQLLQTRIGNATQGLQGLEQVQGKLSDQYVKAVQYLAQTAPSNPNANSLTKKPWNPTPSAIAGWNRGLAAIHYPLSLLETPTTEAKAAVQAVYPETYNALRQMAVQRLANKPDSEVPYQAKLKLARVFDIDLDGNNGGNVAAYQSIYQNQAAQKQARRSNRQMKVASQAQTGIQKLESDIE